MEALQRMNDSLDYMERHLLGNFSVEEDAKISCMSKFHFQRMFQMMTGITVAEYMRKRRLTLAAQELAQSQKKVIDLAFKYGYETAESFAKAFRKVHGISPTEARTNGQLLKAFPRLSFHIELKGGIEMNYKLVEKDAFTIYGKGLQLKICDEQNQTLIPSFWNQCISDGVSAYLEGISGDLGIIGACLDYDHAQEVFTYFIGAEGNQVQTEPSLEKREIPASTWAVFEVKGPMPHAIQHTWKRIYSEWFPSTSYEHSGGPEFEAYSSGDPSSEDYISGIWVPVI